MRVCARIRAEPVAQRGVIGEESSFTQVTSKGWNGGAGWQRRKRRDARVLLVARALRERAPLVRAPLGARARLVVRARLVRAPVGRRPRVAGRARLVRLRLAARAPLARRARVAVRAPLVRLRLDARAPLVSRRVVRPLERAPRAARPAGGASSSAQIRRSDPVRSRAGSLSRPGPAGNALLRAPLSRST
jgi:hypothetical protein